MGVVSVTLIDDKSNTQTNAIAATPLAKLFSYAHQWALQENPLDPCTLTFSSMLAAMTAGADPLCGWLRSHLALRGVRGEWMTKNRSFSPQPLPNVLNTTTSFRLALAKARALCPNEANDGLAVRHFMAAYAVVPSYHLRDFLRLRIDRRAWCIELAEHLASKFPNEKDAWLEYARGANPVPSLGFNTDAPEGRDLLNIDREVEAFARLIASRNSATPLSIGVFGAWGSGKSFFMHRLRKRVDSFAKLGQNEGPQSKFHGRIAQVDFNAWHYSEGNLAASFVDHILRNLRVGPDETTEDLKKRSEEIINQLDSAKQNLTLRQKAVKDAEAKIDEVRQHLSDLDARIADEIEVKKDEVAAARRSLQDVQNKLAKELADLQTEIEEEMKKVREATVARLLLKRLDNLEFSKATNNVRTLIAEAKDVSAKRKLIFYGLIVLAIGAIATSVMQTGFYTQVIAIVSAVGGLAATAATWLGKLDALAEGGKEFEDEQNRIRQEVIDEVTEAHDTVSALRTAAADRLTTVNNLSEQLKLLEQAPATGRLALEVLEKQRADALAQQAESAVVVEAKKAELARLTTGTLLDEFLDDRVSNDGYLKELTIFSRIRNDFERLSDLMTKANEEYVAGQAVNGKVVGPPTVSRIVLYIDDLDRCPANRVVEVLKLVHLLLAFPLFVCVAAVDPRWITQCLHQAPGLIDAAGGLDLTDEVGIPATATDYLEKIFQIPLWLRPVPSEQCAAVARTLLDPSESLEEPRFDLPVKALSKVVVTSPANPEGPEGEDDAPREAPIDPDLISGKELRFLDQLGGLLGGNPRSLKRFVNTYRLVKTALSDVELAVFLQPGRAIEAERGAAMYSPYRICMGQLAVLCTQRKRALDLVRSADKATENLSFTDWLDQSETIDPDLASYFRSAFSEDLEGIDVNTFKLWLERTRRYSFYL
ncbi:MAG: P-loop NTPase fold protein [Methylobacter sp.]